MGFFDNFESIKVRSQDQFLHQFRHLNKDDDGYANNLIIECDLRFEKIPLASLSFKNVKFKGSVDFIKSTKIGKLNFDDCEFDGNVNLSGQMDSLRISYSKGKRIILKLACNTIKVFQASFQDMMLIEVFANDILFIENRELKVEMQYVYCGNLNLVRNRTDFILSTYLLENRHATLSEKITGSTSFQNLELEIVPDFSGKIHLSNSESKARAMMTGHLKTGEICFASSSFEVFEIVDFNNNGVLKFTDISGWLRLEISNSDLGKTSLYNVDFSLFDLVFLHNSNIQDILYLNVKWCKKLRSPYEVREVYRQVKTLAIRQNDKPTEIRFHALEMAELRNSDYLSKNDKFVLWFNFLTNKNGQSWTLPLLLILITVLLTYFRIKVLLGFNHFSPQNWHVALAEITECFNPIRKFSDSFGLQGKYEITRGSSVARFLDVFFLRIVVGLLIFQMIKPFRKYVR